MLNERIPIPVEEAITRVMHEAKLGDMEYVQIEEVYQRVLASNIVADHDVPSFDRSPYDGFAIIAKDTGSASAQRPITLEVVGHIGAGSVYNQPLQKGQAVRIMTGAQIPDGADAVIMLEHTETVTDSDKTFVNIQQQMKHHQNISFQGEDVQKGETIVERGTLINPGIAALLATFGYKKVPVTRKPVVGVIATGSELLEVDQPLQKGKIRNSNTYMLMAQIERAGAKPKYFGQASDQLDVCINQMKKAIDEVDSLITTGGVSVGDYDLLPEIYEHFDAKVLFNKVAMRPGSVTTVAKCQDTLLFGLSGNPSACYVGFELFTKPLIQAFLQQKSVGLSRKQATLDVDFSKANPFDRFIRGHAEIRDGMLVAYPAGKDKSNMVHSLADANVLIRLPGGTEGFQKGDSVEVWLLENDTM
ncbi:gephyrin-like molybdotransferase Glp [Gracilibacillus sp. YIM 98692]|uniref:molybdopterin molybdotransferase MoeA n=1 Tax=Gracilibacillus sp. YIM 98692 TaxID=2663532 RepID=UPI0013CFCDF0|nr:gephyrin-like molybdotransferase Glp [Gracilibacillus sp. YIM 98692]